MRTTTPPEPTLDASLRTVAGNPQSALQITRDAIARWSGKRSAHALPKDVYRVSPQARHLDQAQRGLAAWIAQGGFSQELAAPAAAPRYRIPALEQLCGNRIDACMD